jgi:hypothetical protein
MLFSYSSCDRVCPPSRSPSTHKDYHRLSVQDAEQKVHEPGRVRQPSRFVLGRRFLQRSHLYRQSECTITSFHSTPMVRGLSIALTVHIPNQRMHLECSQSSLSLSLSLATFVIRFTFKHANTLLVSTGSNNINSFTSFFNDKRTSSWNVQGTKLPVQFELGLFAVEQHLQSYFYSSLKMWYFAQSSASATDLSIWSGFWHTSSRQTNCS